ncbi:MBOAT family protein [candidate division KSB1 bacterium]|nr:MBOAT family protein [candidate division KSB1 bacterium]
MLFNSFIFLIFLGVVIPVYYLLSKRYRTWFLIACSYFFYGYWDWRFLSLILVSTLVDFIAGKKIYKTSNVRHKKYFLFLSLLANLGILGFFKYFNFFVDSFQNLSAAFNVQLDFLHLNVLLPVGISFYTFQTLSYTIDVYRGRLEPTDSFPDFALYVAFFPQLVAGPIERAVHLLPQIQKLPVATRQDFREGFALLTIGMFKKVLIGDTCGRIVDHIFSQPSLYTSLELFMALVLFSVQIYADFSGYSNIARGTAKFLGIHLIENFNQPYLSASITEFWRRWHISLSSWLKDYLYISLGGNRRGKLRTYVNLMTTMLLGGLWHGANWTFVVWGGLHGTYLAVHKIILGQKKTAERFYYKNPATFFIFLLKLILTNLLVLLTWLFFRAPNFQAAFFIIGRFVHWESGENVSQIITIMLTFVFVIAFLDIVEYSSSTHAFLLKLKKPVLYAVYAVVWYFVLLYMYQATPMPFIYFQF